VVVVAVVPETLYKVFQGQENYYLIGYSSVNSTVIHQSTASGAD
jgi:hypothetical protein